MTPDQLAILRMILLLPGADRRSHGLKRSNVSVLYRDQLVAPTDGDPDKLTLTPKGVEVLKSRNLHLFGRLHKDCHELHLRDRMASFHPNPYADD